MEGAGLLMLFTFEGLAPGSSEIKLADFNPRDSKLQPIKAPAPKTVVVVK